MNWTFCSLFTPSLFARPRSGSCLLPICPFRAAVIQLHCSFCSQGACARVSLGPARSPQARLLEAFLPLLGPSGCVFGSPSLCVYPGWTPPSFQQVHMKFWSFSWPGDACVKKSHHHDTAASSSITAVVKQPGSRPSLSFHSVGSVTRDEWEECSQREDEGLNSVDLEIQMMQFLLSEGVTTSDVIYLTF